MACQCLTGCEAQLHWQNDDSAVIEPPKFIAVVESSDLIVSTGDRLLDVKGIESVFIGSTKNMRNQPRYLDATDPGSVIQLAFQVGSCTPDAVFRPQARPGLPACAGRPGSRARC